MDSPAPVVDYDGGRRRTEIQEQLDRTGSLAGHLAAGTAKQSAEVTDAMVAKQLKITDLQAQVAEKHSWATKSLLRKTSPELQRVNVPGRPDQIHSGRQKRAKLPLDCTLEELQKKLGKLLKREPSSIKLTKRWRSSTTTPWRTRRRR